jgi:hypothetical protein
MIFTYSDATDYPAKIESYAWDGEGWESEPVLVIDFVFDADSGIEFESFLKYMMFQPWKWIMMPYIGRMDLFYC